MKGQYEQHYNAAALKQIGVPVMKRMKKKSVKKIGEWLDQHDTPHMEFGNITAEAVGTAIGLAEGVKVNDFLIET